MPGADRLYVNRPLVVCHANYLIAHSAKSLAWHSSGVLFAFFLTETCGLSPRAMEVVVALSLMVNAAADVILGRAWHRGEHLPYTLARVQAIGAGLTASFFVGFCALPLLPAAMRLAMAGGLLIAFRLSFAMLDVSQNAMVAIFAQDASGRRTLLAARNVCSGLATLSVVLVAAPMLLGGSDRALRHLGWAGAVGAAMTLSAIVLARSPTVRRAAPTVESDRDHRAVPFPLLLAIAGALVVASTLFRSLEPYAVAYAGFGPGILKWAAIGTTASQPFWLLAAPRLSRRKRPRWLGDHAGRRGGAGRPVRIA